MQKYRFPLSPSNTTPGLIHTLHTPTIKQTCSAPLADSSLVPHNTHFQLGFTSFSLSLPSAETPIHNNKVHQQLLRLLLLLFTISSVSEGVGAPGGGCVASWLSLIHASEGRLICIADSCATIGYILPHPEPEKQGNQERNRAQKKRKTRTLNILSELSANLWFSYNNLSTSAKFTLATGRRT